MTAPITAAPGRPRLHFTPTVNWMNDPNGLIHHNGLFHLFFQHNPLAPEWGNMSWGHATSQDLLAWQEHAVALPFDHDEEVFSGSTVFDANNSSGLGTADAPPLIALYTSAKADGQAQALASSADGGYTWTKHGVVLDRGTTDFRDPKVFRHGDWWILLAVEAVDRQAHLFRSKDLRNWEPLSVFGPYGAREGIWECPDLFQVGDRWILTISVNPGHPAGGSGMQYILGDFDGTTFTPSQWGWLDHGHDYYAGVTFSGLPEPTMLAWMNNWLYAHDIPTDQWRGSTALPRRITLRGGDTLIQLPAVDITARPAYEVRDLELVEGRFELPTDACGPAMRIQCSIRPGRSSIKLCLRVGEGGESGLSIRYDAGSLAVHRAEKAGSGTATFGTEATADVALPDGVLDLDIWLDTTSVEIFADGGATTLSEQVFAPDDHDGVFITSSLPGATIEHLTVTDLRNEGQTR